jgi:hypothetical protein
MVINKDDNPKWYPKNGVTYTLEEAIDAASQTGEDYIIVMENSSNDLIHEFLINNLEMGTRYLFKPWFKYVDGAVVKYISSNTQYASDEFYRHQDILNSLEGELAKITHELNQKLDLPEASFTQTLLGHAVDDATDAFKDGVTEGIKSYVLNGVLKKTGLGALNKLNDKNAAKITRYYDDAKAAYDQGKEYAEIVQTVNDGLQADNPCLELSKTAVTMVAPYAEPIFYVTELAVESYVETSGIKAEIEVLTEFTQRMKEHLEVETQNLLETIKSETYYGFCVTNLGGVLDHDFNLKLKNMPYLVSSDLILSQTPAIDDGDGKVTLSMAHTNELLIVLLKDGVNIIVEKGAEFDVQGGIFDKAGQENWGAIVYKQESLGRFIMADVYNGGKNQDAQLIIRSSGQGNTGFELYPDLYASLSAGVLIDNAKINARNYIGAKSNKGPGVWLKNPKPGTLIKRIISKFNYQGLVLEGEALFENSIIGTRVGTKIQGNQHPGTPSGSEDLVFLNMDYSHKMGEFIHTMDMLKPIAGILLGGKEIILDEKMVKKFTIPSGREFSILNSPLKTVRFSDCLAVEGIFNLDGKITALADSENVHGFIDVIDGGELNAANVTFTSLDSTRNWDGIRFLESAGTGILDRVTLLDGGAGSIGAQLTIETHVRVKDCLFTNSQGIGVKVDQPFGLAPEFTKNKISKAKKHGLYAYNVSSKFQPRDNIFEASNGDKTHYFAVSAASTIFSRLDARHNYWDDYSGPRCVDNPAGLGATAGALVDFDPWTGKIASDPIPEGGSGSPVFDTDWDRDIHNGGYDVRTSRHSNNVLSIYPLKFSQPKLNDQVNEGGWQKDAEQLFTCYAIGSRPRFKVTDNGSSLESVPWRDFLLDQPGDIIYFTRVAHSLWKNNDTDEIVFKYRKIDDGHYIPYIYDNNHGDIRLSAGASPYFMKGDYWRKITIEPGVIILMAYEGIELDEIAALNAKDASFISVAVPDLDNDGFIREEEIQAYMGTINSIKDIKPEGNHVKFKAYRGAGISMDNCLVINQKMGSSSYKSSTSEKGCAESGFIVKNSKLYNFSLSSAGGAVEMTDNLISTYSTVLPDLYYDTTYYIYASTASEECPVTFKNNRVHIPTVKGKNAQVKYEIKIRGGTGDVDVSNNEITGGVELDVLIKSDTQNPSNKRVTIKNNMLYDSEYGIKISSDSSTSSKYFNINRLNLSDNYVQTNPGSWINCGTNCKIPIMGLVIENFNASDIGITMEAANNDVGLASFGGAMNSGVFTLTADLAKGLAGEGRRIALNRGNYQLPFFRINKDAVFNITGTTEKPITILGLRKLDPSLMVSGELNADHVRFIQQWNTIDFSDTRYYAQGISFYEGSKGTLNNISMRGMEKGISLYSKDVKVTDSIFYDNNTALELFNVSAQAKNNRFVRNGAGISLDVEDQDLDTFSAAPILQYNIFEANLNGIKINRLSSNISLKTGNKFIGDNTSLGLEIENNTGTGLVDAANIYWGDDSGPLALDNPDGKGVKIEDPQGIVTFTPWQKISGLFTITTSTSLGKGTLNPPGPVTADYGETIEFSLIPNKGYHLEGIIGTCSGALDMEAMTFTTDGIINDCSLIANFEINIHTLRVNYQGRGTIKGDGINCPFDNTQDYNHGTNAVLIAKENPGYAFSHWINCDNPSGNQCTMTMDDDKTCTAIFKIGDISGDGNINLVDPILILKTITKKTTQGQTIHYIDINNDQKIGQIEAINGLQSASELNK